jgi:choline dehydrogenase
MTDYVIVGAGSAGCILAERLSADPTIEVTLLEAGGSDASMFYRMPAGMLGLMKTGMGNWNYETVPQPGLNGRTMYFPRGKVLGGSGSINGQVYVRGNRGDFDGWAQAGSAGWSYDECLPYFRKLERHGGGNSEFRGGSGPVGITVAAPVEAMSPMGKAWFQAAAQAGYPINPDFNGASQEGFAQAEASYADGLRQSTSATYLHPAMRRPNLTVITKAQATRIDVRGGRAMSVQYVRNGQRKTIHADREIILAGGAVNSPQLLQLSGIGPASWLRQRGVATVHDLPGVGANLQDHACVMVKQEMTKPWSALSYMKPWKAAMGLVQYALFRNGPTVSNGIEVLAFVKTRPGLEYPDIQYHFVNLLYEDHGRKIIQKEGFMASANVSRPASRGTVMIDTNDPLRAPLIDPNYFSDPEDLRAMRESIRISRELIASSAFDEFRGEEYAPGVDVRSDEQLDHFIRSTAASVYHPVGTCRMGNDPKAVVDERLRVHGITGLRVVDASIMPTIVSGNTNAATMMIGEKAADLILQDASQHGVVQAAE